MLTAMPGDATKNPFYQGMEGEGPLVEKFKRFQEDIQGKGLSDNAMRFLEDTYADRIGYRLPTLQPNPRGYVEPGRSDLRMGRPTPTTMPLRVEKQVDTPTPPQEGGVGFFTDADGNEMYQPPMPEAPPGMSQIMVMPEPIPADQARPPIPSAPRGGLGSFFGRMPPGGFMRQPFRPPPPFMSGGFGGFRPQPMPFMGGGFGGGMPNYGGGFGGFGGYGGFRPQPMPFMGGGYGGFGGFRPQPSFGYGGFGGFRPQPSFGYGRGFGGFGGFGGQAMQQPMPQGMLPLTQQGMSQPTQPMQSMQQSPFGTPLNNSTQTQAGAQQGFGGLF